MLSPHEFATLVLINEGSDPRELDCVDVDALLTHQLVTLDSSRPVLTTHGGAFLKALGHARQAPCRTQSASR